MINKQKNKHTNSVMRMPTSNSSSISLSQHNTTNTDPIANHHPNNPQEKRGGDLIVHTITTHHPMNTAKSIASKATPPSSFIPIIPTTPTIPTPSTITRIKYTLLFAPFNARQNKNNNTSIDVMEFAMCAKALDMVEY